MRLTRGFKRRQFQGEVFLIVGGTSGYGREAAIHLAQGGADVVIAARHAPSPKGLGSLPRAFSRQGRIEFRPCDLTDESSVKSTVRAVVTDLGRLSGCVITAASPYRAERPTGLMDIPTSEWNTLIATNVTGSLLVAREALRAMLSTPQGGQVVLFTSRAGWASTLGHGPYNVSKAALNALCASLANEAQYLSPAGLVRVNAIEPGEARTGMNAGSGVHPRVLMPLLMWLLGQRTGGPNGQVYSRDGLALSLANDHLVSGNP